MSSPSNPISSDKAVAKTAEEARSQRTWNDFLPILNHGIRTPLNGILGMSKLLTQGRIPADERRHAEVIQSSAESLLQLIDDLADLSKMEAGQLALEADDFSLHDLVRESVELLKPRARAKRLDLRFTVDKELREGLSGDSRRLRQVLVHLITNGITFTRRGFVFVAVTRESAPQPGDERPWIRFSIRDTGLGVAPESVSNIFEPFIQGASSDTGSYGGHGLGLTLSRGFVRLMGGEIDVESTPGQGSSFAFSIPCEPARQPELLSGPPSPEVPSPPSPSRKRGDCRILIAEDDEVNRMVALRVLEDVGYRAIAVPNGIKVLEAIEQGSYDLILMDCQMPELDGYDTARLIRQLEKGQQRSAGYHHIPVIAVTALSAKPDRKNCVDAGMDDFVAKPYRAEELLAVIDQHLGFGPPDTANPKSRILQEKAGSDVLDPEIIGQFRELTGPLQEGFLNTLVDTFVRERVERGAELRQAFEDGDGQRLAKLSHKLISASGSVGAYRLAKLAGDLEICSRDKPLAQCRATLDELMAEYGLVEAALWDVLASAKSS